jgi:hypothetical protein
VASSRTSSDSPPVRPAARSEATGTPESDLLVPRQGASRGRDVFDVGGDDDLDLDDDFDVPSFLR